MEKVKCGEGESERKKEFVFRNKVIESENIFINIDSNTSKVFKQLQVDWDSKLQHQITENTEFSNL